MKRLLSLIIAGFGITLATMPGVAEAADHQTQPVQVAVVPLDGQFIQVSTMCQKGSAIFKITNTGEALPFAYSFNIVRVNSNTVVSKRRLKMAAGQNATFKVKHADRIPSQIGLRVEAKDYERDGQIHALVRCDV